MKPSRRNDFYAWNREAPREYRWRCGLRESRWFKSYRSAGNDAVRRGLATWDGDRLWTGPLVEIEQREAAGHKKSGAG